MIVVTRTPQPRPTGRAEALATKWTPSKSISRPSWVVRYLSGRILGMRSLPMAGFALSTPAARSHDGVDFVRAEGVTAAYVVGRCTFEQLCDEQGYLAVHVRSVERRVKG